jgi:hypothetical protein
MHWWCCSHSDSDNCIRGVVGCISVVATMHWQWWPPGIGGVVVTLIVKLY